MSETPFSAYDSGHHHAVPLVVALVLSAIVLGLSWALAGGLPH
jgi:multisubunit Na+/H+ antiporter MnhC subunit